MKDPMTSLEDEVARLTEAALKKVIPRLPELVPDETLTAVVFYCAESLEDVALAVQTQTELRVAEALWREELDDVEEDDELEGFPTPPLAAFEVCAADWDHLGVGANRFRALHALLEDDDEDYVRDLAREAGLIEGMRRAQRAGLFSSPPFAPSVLFGIQFAEGGTALDLVERSSELLNDAHLHEKVKAYCEYERACLAYEDTDED